MTTENEPSPDRIHAEQAINAAFSPHAPINAAALFRGRRDQIREVVDTVGSQGLHAVIYGERGVGKTSLANILNDYLAGTVSVSKVICGQGDSFTAVVRRAVGSIQLSLRQRRIGFAGQEDDQAFSLLEALPDAETLSPDAVATVLAQIPLALVLVFDEFDRLPAAETGHFADFIKALSDRGATTTLILVGVAEDIDHLLNNHASVVRNLRQIRLPRMSDEELGEIIEQGLSAAGFRLGSIDPRDRIVAVSQGFPHYTHLLAQYGARHALDSGRLSIEDADVLAGMQVAVERGDQSHRDLYYRAVTGTRKSNLWVEVVTGCALAVPDERGYFAIRDVQDQVSKILGKLVTQQAIAYHLGKLTDSDRGPLLERVGPPRRYRYRFINSLMRPFIVMKAMNEGLITP